MKPRMTEDFKKAARGMVIYTISAIIVYPVYHLIKGDFDWGDTIIYAGIMILICLVLGVFFYFGTQVPEKKDE